MINEKKANECFARMVKGKEWGKQRPGGGGGKEMPSAQIQFCVLTGHLPREAKLEIYSAVNLPSLPLITGNAAAAELDSCYYTARKSNFSLELPPHAIDIESITHWGWGGDPSPSSRRRNHVRLSDFFFFSLLLLINKGLGNIVGYDSRRK